MECTQPISLNSKLDPWSKFKIGLEWYLFKTGLGATNHFEAGGFIRSKAGVKHPDLQYHFMPAAINYNAPRRPRRTGFRPMSDRCVRKSRGTVRLASSDPAKRPIVDPNYMSHQEDWEEMRASVRLTREIFAQDAFKICVAWKSPRARISRPMNRSTPGSPIMLKVRIIHPVRAKWAVTICPLSMRKPRARHRRFARGGQLDHAEHCIGQPQCADHHDRRKGRRHHPRSRSAAAIKCAIFRSSRMGNQAALIAKPHHRK